MVSIIPGTARTAADLTGQQTANAIQQNVQPQLNQMYQRQRGYAAIDRLQQDLASANGDMSKILPAIARAYTDNPSLERSGIAEQALKTAQGNRVFGRGQGQEQSSSYQKEPLPQFNSTPGRENFQRQSQPVSQEGQPGVTNQDGLPQPGEPTDQGVLPRIRPVAEVNNLVANASQNDPQQAAYWQNYYAGENKLAQQQRELAAQKLQQLEIPPSEIPEAMNKIGEKYGWMTNLDDWAISTKRDYDEYKNNKKQLSNATTPGFFRGLISSPADREKSLSTLEEPVKNLVKLGFEQEVRKELSGPDMDLSPTEVESTIHPLSKNFKNNFSKLPSGPFKEFVDPHKRSLDLPIVFKSYDQLLKDSPKTIDKMNDRLSDFLLNNIKEDTSLLPVRHKLWREKGYDWRQFIPSLSKAREKGLKLSTAQQAELTELSNQPPRDSLSDIFMSWGRWIDYIKGQK